jgi:mannose-6-phosphate isomerase-like protein (cupin superfamily)
VGARIEGTFVWHHHADTDEVFIVLEGRMVIELRDGEPRVVGEGLISTRRAR